MKTQQIHPQVTGALVAVKQTNESRVATQGCVKHVHCLAFQKAAMLSREGGRGRVVTLITPSAERWGSIM
jgi:hypothetical protein